LSADPPSNETIDVFYINNEKHNNQSEKTSETKWENIKTMVTAVTTEVVG